MTLKFTVQSPATKITCICKKSDHIKEWCDQWLLPLNINKCFHMSYTSRLISIDTAYHINNTDSVSNIQKVDQIKDLGILYDSHLTFQDHIQEKINKAYSMIGLIKRNFIHMDSRTFIMRTDQCFVSTGPSSC